MKENAMMDTWKKLAIIGGGIMFVGLLFFFDKMRKRDTTVTTTGVVVTETNAPEVETPKDFGMIVHDKGASFKVVSVSVSNRSLAPVVPENPHLKK